MPHPCASRNPPAWCTKKRGKRKAGAKRRRRGNLSALPKIDLKNYSLASRPTCLRRKGKRMVLKKGCVWGRGSLKGKLLKRKK